MCFRKKTSTSTTSTTPPAQVLANYNYVNELAKAAASKPFQKYGTQASDFVAQINPQQTMGISGINAAANSYQPYMTQATEATNAGMGPAYAGIDNYMSPYIKNVADTTAAMMRQQQEQAQSGALGNAVSSGAFGGDRAGIAAANLQQQNQMAYGKSMADIYNQGYTQALGASQADLARQLQGGAQLAGIGAQTQQLGLAGGQAQIAAGSLQQQTEQAGKDALINQFMQEQGYPFQTAQFLANIYTSTGPASGTQTTNTQPAPFWSDRRLKHDVQRIGRTDDGQPIYRFKYNGSNQVQMGLMADQVEKHHPDAVGTDPKTGYQYVDYDRATKHMASGGVAGPYQITIGSSPGTSGYMPENYVRPTEMLLPDASWIDSVTQRNEEKKTGLQDLIDNISRIKDTWNELQGEYQPKASGGSVDDNVKDDPVARGYLQPILDAMAGRKVQELLGASNSSGGNGGGSGGGGGGLGGILDTALKVKNLFGFEQGGVVGDRHGYALDGGVSYPALTTEELRREQEIRKQLADGMGIIGDLNKDALMRAPLNPANMGLAGRPAPESPTVVSSLAYPQPLRWKGETANGLSYKAVSTEALRNRLEKRQNFSKQMGLQNDEYLASSNAPLTPANMGVAGRDMPQSPTSMASLEALAPTTSLRPPARPEGLGAADAMTLSMRPQRRPTDLGTPATEVSAPKLDAGLGGANFTKASAGETPSNGVVGPNNAFDNAVGFTLQHEGGFNPRDANGAPVNFGINQAAHPEVDVSNITQDQAREIYRRDYWLPINGDALSAQDPALATAVFDTAVISGVGKAKELLEQSGGDRQKFLQLRAEFLNGLIQSNPEKYGKYAKAWNTRNLNLGAPNMFSAAGEFGSQDFTGGLAAGVKPYEDRNFLGQIFHNKNDGKLNRDAVMSLLSGVGTMLASPSQFFLPTLGAGLAAGANTYMAREGQRADITAQNIANLKKIQQNWLDATYNGMTTDTWQQYAANHGVDPADAGAIGSGTIGGEKPITTIDTRGSVVRNGITVPNMNDYEFLQTLVNKNKGVDPESPMGRIVAEAKDKLTQIELTGTTYGTDPTTGKQIPIPVPQVVSAGNIESQRAASRLAGQQFAQDKAENYGTVERSLALTNEQISVFKDLPAGQFATATGTAGAILRALGYDEDQVTNIVGSPDMAANVQKAIKLAAEATIANLSSLPGGAPATEIQQLNMLVADPNLQPAAIAEILALQKAAQEYRLAKYKGWSDPSQDYFEYAGNFNNQNPFQKFLEDAKRGMPTFAGVGSTETDTTVAPTVDPSDPLGLGG